MDHLRRKTLRLDHIKLAVLDEADEMLSMGFKEDMEEILTQAPACAKPCFFRPRCRPKSCASRTNS